MFLRYRLFVPLVILALVFSAAISGCSGGKETSAQDGLHMAAMADMPEEVQAAPATVQQAYQFAVANPEILKEIPCYCGCGAMGHHSNYACYVSGSGEDGKVAFDSHALGCSICVDITQDTMRLMKQGKDVKEIRAYVDQTYARYGPSNITE